MEKGALPPEGESAMDDHEIIDLYWARSEQAIAESECKYGAFCRSIARNILRQEEDAEECVNDTWFRAWNLMPPQRPGILSAFFGRLTRNLSLDRWRYNRAAKRGGSQVEVALGELEECLPDPNRPEERLEERETAALISRFLGEQAPLDRVLFLRQGQIVLNAGVDEIRTQQGKSVDTLFREVFRC